MISTHGARTTPIGTLWGDQTEASSIDFNLDGELYAINNANVGGGTFVLKINPETAEATETGTSIRLGLNNTLYGMNSYGSG